MEDSLKINILEGTMDVFNQKGLKFTMDDVAKSLSISKKTIYTVFADKETLFIEMVDYLFDGIKKVQKEVKENASLSTQDKIKMMLGVMPESYKNIDLRQLYMLKDKYPKIYKKVEDRLESGWEDTIALMEQGINEGVVRPVNIAIVKMMLEASLEQFFQRDILVANNMTYNEGLDQVVDILIDGIMVK